MGNAIPIAQLAVFLGCLTLAAWIAGISYGKDRGLAFWAGALTCFAVVYGFLSFELPMGPIFSVVLANVALACTLALLAECVLCWQNRRSLHGWVRLPVMVAAAGFLILLDDPRGRIMLGAAVFASQSLLILMLLLQKRKQLRSTVLYLVEIGAASIASLFVLRAVFTLSGRQDVHPLVVSDHVQASTLLLSVISVMLLGLGFELLGGSMGDNEQTVES